jgi:hypothetical protein
MDIEQIKERITELERARDEFSVQARTQFAERMGEFNGRIAELEAMLAQLEKGIDAIDDGKAGGTK